MRSLSFSAVCAMVMALSLVCVGAAAEPDKEKAEGKKPLLVKTDQLVATDPYDTLPTTNYRKVYERKLTAGQRYFIEMTTPWFAPMLRLEDSTGRVLGNALFGSPLRIEYTPVKTDTYRVIVASRFSRQTGAFTLRVLEPDGKPFEKTDVLGPDDPVDKVPTLRYCKRYDHKLAAGELYVIEMKSPLIAPQVRVEDSRGAQVAANTSSGRGQDARVHFTPSKPAKRDKDEGVYTVIATSAYNSNVGPFTLTLLRPGIKAGVNPLEKEARLQESDPFDRVLTRSHRKVYEHKFDRDRVYTLQMSSSAFQPYLRVEDNEGRQLLAEGADANVLVVFVPPASRSYRIIATSRGPDKRGPFTLKVSATRESAAQRIKGKLDAAATRYRVPGSRYCKRYPWKMVAGTRYVVEASSSTFAPGIFIEDSTGQFVAREKGTAQARQARLSFAPANNGDYQIIVTSALPYRTGDFALRIYSTDPSKKPALDKNEQLDGKDPFDTIATGKHYKSYQVNLTLGKVYDVEMTSPRMEPCLYLQDSGGRVLAQEDSGGDSTVLVRFSPPATGKYTIFATTSAAGKTGTFSLRVIEVASKSAPLLKEAGSLRESDPIYTARTENHHKVYNHKMKAGQVWLIRLQSKDFTPWVRVEDEKKNEWARASGSKDQPAVLIFPCRRDGEYRLIASSTEKMQTGDFRLTVEHLPNSDTKEDRLDADSPALTMPTPWQFRELVQARFVAGMSYVVQIDGPQQEVRLAMRTGPAPAKLPEAGTSHIAFTPERTGDHPIVVFGTKQEGFLVTVRPLVQESTQEAVLALADPRDLQPTGRYCKTWSHRLIANQPYVLQAWASGFRPLVRVVDEKGITLGQSNGKTDSAVLTFTPAIGGEYTIVATSQSLGQTGAIRIQLRPLEIVSQKPDRLTSDEFDGTPTASTRKVYEQQLDPKKLYHLQLSSPTFDALLRVTDMRGALLAQGNSVFSGGLAGTRRSQLTFLPPRLDSYRLTATSLTAGRYGSFKLIAQPFSPAWTKAESLTPTDSFDRVPTLNHRKSYDQELEKDKPYIIAMVGKTFAGSVRLEDGRSNELQRSSSYIAGSPARMVVFPARSEKYKVVATSTYGGQTGQFTLRVSSPETVTAQDGKLTAEDFFDPLRNDSYQKVHSIKLKGGEFYLISLESSAFVPELRIESSRGKHLGYPSIRRAGETHVTFLAPSDDTYRIVVTTTYSRATGAYRLLIRQ